MELPKDPFILLSYVNTKLRDECRTLGDFCQTYGISEEDLCDKLDVIHYHYEEKENRFV